MWAVQGIVRMSSAGSSSAACVLRAGQASRSTPAMTTTRKSNFSAALRTTILMATLGGLMIAIGYAIGGIQIASVFLLIALAMNFIAFFFSDKIAIASARAKPIEESDNPRLYQMVRELTPRAGLPMPRLYMIPI